MHNRFTRRTFGAFAAGAVLATALPAPVLALNVSQARALIDKVLGEIDQVINSGMDESQMYVRFESIFSRYADVGYIARTVLGPAGRAASPAQIQAFTKAYQRYISVKYGKRFHEMIGARIEVTDAHPLKSFFEVVSVARLQGQAPFEVRWHVFEKGGQIRFFNLIIEGVNLLASERAEIGALLDRNGGNIDKMIAALGR